jgi:hypothetical protein
MRTLPRPTRESSSSVEIAPRPIRALACEAIEDIDGAISILRAYGVKVPESSRLHQAKDVLMEAVNTGALVPAHRGDSLGLRALETSLDFSAIAATLPPTRVADVRRELSAAVEGGLELAAENQTALQYQSQYVVRAALVRAGLQPMHPLAGPRKGKKPDLLIEQGTMTYGIEAKRPQAARNVVPRMEDARDQLRHYGVAGAVLIDVSDCIRHVARSALDDAVRSHALSMYERIFVPDCGYNPGYSGIMLAGAYARVAWTAEDGPLSSMISVHSTSTIGLFAVQENSLADHHARRLRAAIHHGFGLLGQTLSERAAAAAE